MKSEGLSLLIEKEADSRVNIQRNQGLFSQKRSKMVENIAELPEEYDLNAKWDACIDLSLRRFVYSSFAGGIAGILLFRECFFVFLGFTCF